MELVGSPTILPGNLLLNTLKSSLFTSSTALLTLLLSDLAATAQYHNEEALQQTARELYDLIMCPLCAGQTIAQSNNETKRRH